MKQALGLFIFCISFSAFGANSKNCAEIKSEQIRLALTASNLGNENTTRTPEGGALQTSIAMVEERHPGFSRFERIFNY